MSEFDEKNQPGNPYLLETVQDFLQRLKATTQKRKFPPGTKFECHRCGECCKWHYFHLNISNQKLLDQMYMFGLPQPHGYWVLFDGKINCYMPVWSKEMEKKLFHFDGFLPKLHTNFLNRTRRKHGYWVLNENDKVVIYCPVRCIHLTENNLCSIYPDRPEICRMYSCERYPVQT